MNPSGLHVFPVEYSVLVAVLILVWRIFCQFYSGVEPILAMRRLLVCNIGLFFCLYAFSSLIFHQGIVPDISHASSLLFHWISRLLICINVGLMYFLSVNIFVSLLVGFCVVFHVEYHRDYSSREFCKTFIANSQSLFCVIIAVPSAKIAN